MIPIHNHITDNMTRCQFTATTTAIIMGVAAVAATSVSAYGAYSQGQATKHAQEYNAEVASNNAKAASMQANQDAQLLAAKGRRIKGAQIAQFAASGVDPSSGSSVDIQQDSTVQNELDQLTTRYRGATQSSAYDSQAAIDRASGSNAGMAGTVNAGGTILSGVGQGFYNYTSIANNPSFVKGHG